MTAARTPATPGQTTEKDDHMILLLLVTALLGLIVTGIAFFVADLVELFQMLERSAGRSTP